MVLHGHAIVHILVFTRYLLQSLLTFSCHHNYLSTKSPGRCSQLASFKKWCVPILSLSVRYFLFSVCTKLQTQCFSKLPSGQTQSLSGRKERTEIAARKKYIQSSENWLVLICCQLHALASYSRHIPWNIPSLKSHWRSIKLPPSNLHQMLQSVSVLVCQPPACEVLSATANRRSHVRQYTILHSSFLPDLLAKLSVSGSHARLERTNIPCFQDMAAFCWPLFLGRRLPCKFEFATPTQQAGCRDPAQRFFTAPFMFEFLCLIAVLLRHALRTAWSQLQRGIVHPQRCCFPQVFFDIHYIFLHSTPIPPHFGVRTQLEPPGSYSSAKAIFSSTAMTMTPFGLENKHQH